jgi:adenylate cyclase
MIVNMINSNKEIFEDKLQLEILLSERKRLNILGTIALIPFVFILITYLFFRDSFPEYYQNLTPVVIADIVLLVFAIREFSIARFLTKKIKDNKPISTWAQYFNTLVEVSLPTALILIIGFYWESVAVLSTPLIFMYIIIVILTTLSLNPKLSIFAGAVAAIEFGIILTIFLNKFGYPSEMAVLNRIEFHIGKVMLIFLSGVISGFVANQLILKINNTYKLFEERNRIVELFGQQVSQQIVDELISQQDELQSKRKFVCIMFLDIRGFTPFAESKEPEEVIEYQNKVFGFMIDIITQNGGVINQFLGDGYMATFGAPLSQGSDTQNAFNAAVKIINEIEQKNKTGQIPNTRIGIGLHAGYVVAGNVGTETRKQYSISGNTVITASRIEQLNKEFNSQLLVSEEVINEIDKSVVDYELIGEVKIKGREKPVNLFKIV